ncbi:ABC transporter related [Beutenbergia cavernae DSM 12333]|uniref:ABC transporter related n=1 Tax=Beutenbergia cavernae (strain ATCC BAA-8 / DSM 12333 / CCUG 43141 / JCM 11478 / NBRC 16432 / NCIMB 13614 / HKI 0122) TaxID=471853 RepID=C5C220_BEUC1|nr:ABC transporter ATP-binding protein [Beutenbergia cavernae]ACQ81645.1 ABC transporter related [Beutenbergia cavernae DSM 12333]
MALLEVDHLSVTYAPRDGVPVDAVRDVSLVVDQGEFVGLVGESGSGKSTLGNAILQLLDKPARRTAGSVRFDGQDLADLDPEELRRLRWVDLSTVFQSSMNSLNPVITVAAQFEDTFRAHDERLSPADLRRRAVEALAMVSLDERTLTSYAHELSGGMRQRVSLALALALRPRFVLLDEPTTGLDVLVQRRILDRLRALQADLGFAVLFVTHDIGAVLEMADRMLVMTEGEIVEDAAAADVLLRPAHPYTQSLLASYAATRTPVPHRAADAVEPEVVLRVEDVRRRYVTGRGRNRTAVQALDGVSLELRSGKVTALVGQSGSGKSTIARMVLGVERPDSGRVLFGDVQVDALRRAGLRDYRRHVQMVFQDPFASLNPTVPVGAALARPLLNFGGATRADVRDRAAALLEQVGLTPTAHYLERLPHQLSGGQRQRVVIARALAPDPAILVADEPVSMLDVSIRAEILALLASLVAERELAMLYITHDLLSARALADDVVVLSEGAVVEHGPTARVVEQPEHPYTRELLAAIPDPYADAG